MSQDNNISPLIVDEIVQIALHYKCIATEIIIKNHLFAHHALLEIIYVY